MNKLCLYHRSDLDGKSSGAIVRRAVPGVELYGIEYGDSIPWEKIQEAEVYIVDFSLQPWEDMERLLSVANSVCWIDHHKSAIEEHQASRPAMAFSGIRDVKKSACELCWEYFFTSEPVPRSIHLLGRYDVWDLNADEDIMPFQMGMRLRDTAPDQGIWDTLLGNADDCSIEDITRSGHTVIAYQTRQNKGLMRKSFVHEWQKLKFLAVNAGGINSLAFESKFDTNLHDAVMGFYFAGDQGLWTVSLYSPDQSRDLSGIAKDMGGGGHAAACGFQVKLLSEIGL